MPSSSAPRGKSTPTRTGGPGAAAPCRNSSSSTRPTDSRAPAWNSSATIYDHHKIGLVRPACPDSARPDPLPAAVHPGRVRPPIPAADPTPAQPAPQPRPRPRTAPARRRAHRPRQVWSGRVGQRSVLAADQLSPQQLVHSGHHRSPKRRRSRSATCRTSPATPTPVLPAPRPVPAQPGSARRTPLPAGWAATGTGRRIVTTSGPTSPCIRRSPGSMAWSSRPLMHNTLTVGVRVAID